MKHALIAFFLFPVLLIAQPRFKWTQIEVAPGQGYLVSSQGVNGSWEDSLRFYGGLMRITGGLTMSDVTAITGDSMLVWRNNKVYRRGFRQALSAANAVYGTGLESSIPVWATDSTLGPSLWYLVSNVLSYNNLSPSAGAVMSLESATNSLILPRGTVAQRPGSPIAGMLRYQSDTVALEYYDTDWRILANRAWVRTLLSGYSNGTGAANRVAYWSDANTLASSSALTYDGTTFGVSDGNTATAKPILLDQWTDAGAPTAATGQIGYNSTSGNLVYRGAAAWEYPVKSSTSTGLFTAGRVLFADANGRAAEDAGFSYSAAADAATLTGATPVLYANSTTASSQSAILFQESGSTHSLITGYNSSYPIVSGQAVANSLGIVSRVNNTGSISFLTTTGGVITKRAEISNAGVFRVLRSGSVAAFVADRTDAKAASLIAGFAGASFSFDNSGYFAVVADTRANIVAGTSVGTEVIHATAAGQVGILTTPSYILDVNGTGAIRLPRGTTAQRPTAAFAILRGNSDSTALEYNDGTNWRIIASRTWARSTFAQPSAITWTLAADTGTPQAVTSTQTATWAGGWGINTSVGGTRTVTVEVDSSQVATQYDISGLASTWLKPELEAGNDVLISGDGDFFLVSTGGGNNRYIGTTFDDFPVTIIGAAGINASSLSAFVADTFGVATASIGEQFLVLKANGGDSLFVVNQDGSLAFPQYGSGTFTGTHPKNAILVDGSGNVGEKRWVRHAYTSDADLTISADTLAVALEHRIYMAVTSGASSATEVTIPDAGAAYLHTSIAFTCKDDSGSYACIVNANTATIMDTGVGTDVSTYTISPYKTVVFRVMQTGASTYRWTIQD